MALIRSLDAMRQQLNHIFVDSFGALPSNDSGDATRNGLAIQAAIDHAKSLGGGVVHLSPGRYYTDICLVLPAHVSLVGCGSETTFITKTTSTVSPVVEVPFTVRVGAQVSTVNAVIHMVEVVGGSNLNWSFGTVSDFTVEGNAENAPDSDVSYGILAHGISYGTVERVLARGVGMGFWFGTSIVCRILNNFATRVTRGYYMHFATSCVWESNYVNRFRLQGFNGSFYYSRVSSNASDAGGDPEQGWIDTDLSLAYSIQSSYCTQFVANGCESHNGPVWSFVANIGCEFAHNLGLDIHSSHDGVASGLNCAALTLSGNTDCDIRYNRIAFRSPNISGDALASDHFNWTVVVAQTNVTNTSNRFVDAIGDVMDGGWENTSGSWSTT